MKKALLTLSAVAFSVSVFAQGTVLFNNVNTSLGLKAPIYGPETVNTVAKTGNTTAGLPAGTQTYSGILLSGSAYCAQLFSANGAGQAEGSLAAATPVTTFRTGSAAGYVAGTVATLSNVAKDAAAATLQIRAWDNSSGLYADWTAAQAAWNSGLIAAGKSATFTVNGIGGDFTAQPILAGLTSFNIYYNVPEPTTMALAGLGAAALLIFRRRK